LHISSGGVQCGGGGKPQLFLQVPSPVEPQVVAQDVGCPAQQANPLSQIVSQSSSSPLHVSTGGTHVSHSQEEEQVRVPEEPHDVSHGSPVPAQQLHPLSQIVSQSSSSPLQTSSGGVHSDGSGRVQVEEHTPLPVEPHPVVHETGLIRKLIEVLIPFP